MIECGSLEYAQARLQARHGQRASDAAWQRLEMTREFAALLDAGRSSSLRPWLVGITARSTSHQIETVLRAHWRVLVAEVAGWMPRLWQPALLWCAVWADLPVLQHLARGGEAAAWMDDDPDYRALCAATPNERAKAIAAGRFGALAGAGSQPHAWVRAWHAEWERRLPEPPDQADDALSQVTAAVRKHGAAFAAAAAGQGWLLRRSLQARLSLLLRRATLEPAAAFIHIALCALDLERLRGELLGRALFAQGRVA